MRQGADPKELLTSSHQIAEAADMTPSSSRPGPTFHSSERRGMFLPLLRCLWAIRMPLQSGIPIAIKPLKSTESLFAVSGELAVSLIGLSIWIGSVLCEFRLGLSTPEALIKQKPMLYRPRYRHCCDCRRVILRRRRWHAGIELNHCECAKQNPEPILPMGSPHTRMALSKKKR